MSGRTDILIIVLGLAAGAVILYELLTNTQAIIDALPLGTPTVAGQTQSAYNTGVTSVNVNGQNQALQDVTPGNPNNPTTYGGVGNPPTLTGSSSAESPATTAYYQALSNNIAARSTAT